MTQRVIPALSAGRPTGTVRRSKSGHCYNKDRATLVNQLSNKMRPTGPTYRLSSLRQRPSFRSSNAPSIAVDATVEYINQFLWLQIATACRYRRMTSFGPVSVADYAHKHISLKRPIISSYRNRIILPDQSGATACVVSANTVQRNREVDSGKIEGKQYY